MRHDLVIQQGASFSLRFYVYQSDRATIVGDLTGFSVEGSARATPETSSAAFTFTGEVVTTTTALCQISLTASETESLTSGVYTYDVEVKSGAVTYRPLEGILTVTREMNR